MKNNYYVYVYIDPRNLEEFYYGQGKDERKFSHLKEDGDSEKIKIIKEIKKEGLEPIIRVVARDLTKEQALLIEKTLIWKLGKNLSNIATGSYSYNFRPHNKMHLELYGFDYINGIYYLNVGEGVHRNWDDCLKYGFMTAGQNWEKWGSKICEFKVGDIIAAYLSKHGYVGVGRVVAEAVPATEFRYKDKYLNSYSLVNSKIFDQKPNKKDGEYIVEVEWLRAFPREKAKTSDDAYVYSGMKANLENQISTINFLEKEFSVNIKSLLGMNKSKVEVD